MLVNFMSTDDIASKEILDYGVSDNAVRRWCKQYKLPYKIKDIKYYTDEEWLLV